MKLTDLKKRIFLWAAVLCLGIPAIPAGTQASGSPGVEFPPLIVFSSPPSTVVLPQTDIYAVPDTEEDIFFHDGWWYRPWNGRWYRSRSYDKDWAYYSNTPSFYQQVPPGWRQSYKDHDWGGNPWQYQRIPYDKVQKNWKGWKKDKYWEKQHNWGVQRPGQQRNQQPKPGPGQGDKRQKNPGNGNAGKGWGGKDPKQKGGR